MFGHACWRNEMVCRGNNHYSGGRQRLWMPPPFVSWGPCERCCSLVRESSCLSPCRKIRGAGVPEPARGLSWPARLSGGAAFLERTSRVIGMALTRGARSGGRHVSRRSGSQTRSLSSEGSSPRVLMGHPVLGPINLPGLALYKSGPLGTPGLFPRH